MMKTCIAALVALASLSAFAQIPAQTDFGPAVAAANVNTRLINDLWSQLKITRDQLAKVQGANEKALKDLSDAQAKLATCKAF